MKNNLINLIVLASFVSLIAGCDVKDIYSAPDSTACVDPGLTKTKEVADIYPLGINPSGTPANSPTYTADDIIEGYVISSDEGGNFYQSMYVQPIDGSKGFNISAVVKNIYNKIEPGRKVFLKLKGLGFANPTSFGVGLIFGAPPTDKYAVDRIPALNVKEHLFASCDVVSEDNIVQKNLTIAQLTTGNTHLNTLVEIDGVQFNDANADVTYDTDRTDGYDSTTYITDGTTELGIRTSRYANFAGFKTPVGNGKIRGVLTKYNSGFQIILRKERDVTMNNPRIIKASNPLGGTNLVYGSSLTEPFTTFAVSNTTFSNYINDQTIGNKYWAVKSYSGNNYLEMSSYAGSTAPGLVAKCYFMVPVDFTAANNFSFKKEARFFNGKVLKVYYVKASDFTSGFLNRFVFTDITSKFNITYPTVSGTSESSFTSSGVYKIPTDLTGNGYFVFEYTGDASITTTMQVDDITIN